MKKMKPDNCEKKLPLLGWIAAVIIIVQAVIILSLIQQQSSTGPVLQVRFNEFTREPEIRRFLLAINARIVAGPQANGTYRIQLMDKDFQTIEQQIGELRRKLDIIEYVNAE